MIEVCCRTCEHNTREEPDALVDGQPVSVDTCSKMAEPPDDLEECWEPRSGAPRVES